MCEPVTIAAGVSLAVAAASAVTSVIGQQKQQAAQVTYQSQLVDANKKQMQENRDLATKAYLDQANAENANLAQTRQAVAEQNFDQSRARQQAQGTLMASAAEGGLNGLSLDALLDDFYRQEDLFRTRNDQNLLFKQQQTASTISGLRDTATARTSQFKPYIPSPVAPVDYFGPALSVVGAGANSYMNYTIATKPK